MNFFLDTARALGERKIISRITSRLRRNPKMLADVEDDAAIFRIGADGAKIAVSTDMGVRSTHFNTQDPLKIGRKICVSANTDLLAKGAVPRFMWLDLAFPPQTPAVFLEKMYSSIDRQLSEWGSFLVGGDTNKAKDFVYSAAVLGEIAPRQKPLLRSTAKAGDSLVLTGEVGNAAAGFFFYKNKIKEIPPKYERAQNTPSIDFELCKKIWPYANAGIDVSDGLGRELNEIARQSRKKLVVHFDKLPFDSRLSFHCEKYGWQPEGLLFHRGEDYQCVYSSRPCGHGFEFGEVLEPKNAGEIGVFLEKEGKVSRVSVKGYEHFKSN